MSPESEELIIRVDGKPDLFRENSAALLSICDTSGTAVAVFETDEDGLPVAGAPDDIVPGFAVGSFDASFSDPWFTKKLSGCWKSGKPAYISYRIGFSEETLIHYPDDDGDPGYDPNSRDPEYRYLSLVAIRQLKPLIPDGLSYYRFYVLVPQNDLPALTITI